MLPHSYYDDFVSAPDLDDARDDGEPMDGYARDSADFDADTCAYSLDFYVDALLADVDARADAATVCHVDSADSAGLAAHVSALTRTSERAHTRRVIDAWNARAFAASQFTRACNARAFAHAQFTRYVRAFVDGAR